MEGGEWSTSRTNHHGERRSAVQRLALSHIPYVLSQPDTSVCSHRAAHNQSHVYPFYSSQTHHQPSAADPSRHPSPAPSALPPSSSHGLFLPQTSVSEPSTGQEQPAEPPVDQIQDDAPIDEEPLYVNAKQYYRILKRRVARARLEEVHRLSRQRKVRLSIF